MIKTCENCGVEFVPTNGKQVCCSQRCNASKWRKLNPAKCKESQKRNNEKRRGVHRYNSTVRKEWYKKKSSDKSWRENLNIQYNARRMLIQEFIREYKLSRGCADCGYNKHHAALDFDHIKGEKVFNVCNAKSIKQASEEMKKCEVVCANCHRIRTYERLQNPCTYEPAE